MIILRFKVRKSKITMSPCQKLAGRHCFDKILPEKKKNRYLFILLGMGSGDLVSY